MRLLVLTNHFLPENFRCNDLAFELQKRGHDVTVLTAIPDYPQGSFYKGYGIFRRRCETINGVKVRRAFLIPRGNGGGLRLALNYLSLAFCHSIDAFFMTLFHKFDAVIVHETSPVTVGIPAVIVKKMQRIPLYFWVLDLWPESMQDAGGITSPAILGAFSKLATWIYRNSEKILISSKGFVKSICEKGDFKDKIVYFPNWVDADLQSNGTYTLPDLPSGFNIMFAGNIGEAQDFGHVMESALLLKEEKDIHFILVGDGRKRPWVEEYVQKNGLQDTVHLVGRHPATAMPRFFEHADVMLVSLKDSLIFNLTAPAKFQAYMNAGKPILAMLNGEGQQMVKESDCGMYVNAGDSRALADAILELKEMQPQKLQQWGMSGKAFAEKHFNLDKCINHLCEIIEA